MRTCPIFAFGLLLERRIVEYLVSEGHGASVVVGDSAYTVPGNLIELREAAGQSTIEWSRWSNPNRDNMTIIKFGFQNDWSSLEIDIFHFFVTPPSDFFQGLAELQNPEKSSVKLSECSQTLPMCSTHEFHKSWEFQDDWSTLTGSQSSKSRFFTFSWPPLLILSSFGKSLILPTFRSWVTKMRCRAPQTTRKPWGTQLELLRVKIWAPRDHAEPFSESHFRLRFQQVLLHSGTHLSELDHVLLTTNFSLRSISSRSWFDTVHAPARR